MPADTKIPDIPGQLLEDQETRHHLNQHIGQMCGLGSDGRFPGSQPVSFQTSSLDLLDKKDFWVCEKSDGVRVLLFVVFNGLSGSQEVWLIDRKQRYFFIDNLHFTHWERPDDPLTDTILDGELVIDIDPSGVETLRYYAFDCLVLGGENIMKKTLDKRYARLREWVVTPLKKALQRYPEWKEKMPFDIVAKHQEKSYSVAQVLNGIIPTLQHGHDGLIFTCVETAYVPGTDEHILKWKPPSENSIDFRLELRFPPLHTDSTECDWTAKPVFLLNQWAGGDRYEFFDEMEVDDDEWEQMKESHEEFDHRIVEVTWDADRQAWRMLRFRDDKLTGNHKSIVQKILLSIEDGVELADVLARQDQVRTAWKQREAARSHAQPPPQQQQQQRPPANKRRPTARPPTRAPPPRPPTQGVMAGLKR